MAEENKSGKQGAGQAEGQGDQNAQGGQAGQSGTERHVSKESWDDLLTEKKKEKDRADKLQAQIDKHEADKKKANDEKLKVDGKLQELVESKDKDIVAKTERIRKAELKVAAKDAGLVDLDQVELLMKVAKFNDQDELENGEELFKELKEKKPYLFTQPAPDPKPGTTNNNASWKGGHIFTRAEVESMTKDDLEKNWPLIEKQMGAGQIK